MFAYFLKNHLDRKLYLLLASEKEGRSPQAQASCGFFRKLSTLRSALVGGSSNSRNLRCNAIVREMAKDYDNVTLVETGDFVFQESEQHNQRHFDRIVIRRICEHICRLEGSVDSKADVALAR